MVLIDFVRRDEKKLTPENVDDYRESPALKVIDVFEKMGTIVDYYDPYVPVYYENGHSKESIKFINHEVLNSYDLICITSAHTNIDYEMIADCGIPIFDTKNAMKSVKNRKNVELL